MKRFFGRQHCLIVIFSLIGVIGIGISAYILLTELFSVKSRTVNVAKEAWIKPVWRFDGFNNLTDLIGKKNPTTVVVCSTGKCLDENQLIVGDGTCDNVNGDFCCFDGGDCSESPDDCSSVSGFNSYNDMICESKEQALCKDTSNDCQDLDQFLMGQLCSGCNLSSPVVVGDRSCNFNIAEHTECCFDGGDCLLDQHSSDPSKCFEEDDVICDRKDCSPLTYSSDCKSSEQAICSTCPSGHNQTLLDGVCWDNVIDDPTCCFDALDCHDCFTCPRPESVADHFCDADLLTESCCLDGGDCSLTSINVLVLCQDCHFAKYLHSIGDEFCQLELANLKCCFDGGDCSATLKNSHNWCSSCTSNRNNVHYDLYLQNGICEDQYNRSECCYDGGDCIFIDQHMELCPSCILDHYVTYVTNQRCDNLFNNHDCCFDGGYCHLDVCSTCKDQKLKLKINDGICDSVLMQFPKCCNDGDDCLGTIGFIETACATCQVSGANAFLGTGQCDEFMNNHVCCFDGGDCDADTVLSCNDCDNPSLPLTADDGICDLAAGVHHLCCYDGGDCLKWGLFLDYYLGSRTSADPMKKYCPYCSSNTDDIANGVCDEHLNNEQCCFDGSDCLLDLGNCNVVIVVGIGDGLCDSTLNNPGCKFDLGDCSWSNVCKHSCGKHVGSRFANLGIHDGICHEELDNEHCCYDGGDCSPNVNRCPTCPPQLSAVHNWLGDGLCDEHLDRPDCCFDLGDCQDCQDCYNHDIADHQCLTCPVVHFGLLDDGFCDVHLFNADCCLDGSDCDGTRLRCPTCSKDRYPDLGNRACDNDLDNFDCCFDEGDCQNKICPTCPEHERTFNYDVNFFGDDVCDWGYNTEECCYDNNDCFVPSICPTCNFGILLRNPFNGQCDLAYNTSECCFDGGDCFVVNHNRDGCVRTCIEFSKHSNPLELFGNFVCDPSMNREECCFDLGDCNLVQASICPTCDNVLPSHLKNFYCNPELNNIQCCFDSGDCYHDRFQCDTCLDKDLSWFRDSVCDKELNSLECCYDGGDCSCPSCSLLDTSNDFEPNRRWIWGGVPLYLMALGNWQCDRLLDTPECCFDGFDCRLNYNRICPTCGKEHGIVQSLLGDGHCQPEWFYNMACCFDAGDCDLTISGLCNTCQHPKVAWLGDGYCDIDLFSVGIDCCWDLDDCQHCSPDVFVGKEPISLHQTFGSQAMSACNDVDNIGSVYTNSVSREFLRSQVCVVCPSVGGDKIKCERLGDGICHQELLNAASCFDLGDCWCQFCSDRDWRPRVGDGICNKELMTSRCCFDKGDCSHQSNVSTVCPTCGQMDNDDMIANGQCDNFLLHMSCCYDGGDCGCPTCSGNVNDVGNGRCDRQLESEECCYDGGDCRCLEVTLAFDECCPESGSGWCFPPNTICPTCSLSLMDNLNNGQCDESLRNDPTCCLDGQDCVDVRFESFYFINGTKYAITFNLN